MSDAKPSCSSPTAGCESADCESALGAATRPGSSTALPPRSETPICPNPLLHLQYMNRVLKEELGKETSKRVRAELTSATLDKQLKQMKRQKDKICSKVDEILEDMDQAIDGLGTNRCQRQQRLSLRVMSDAFGEISHIMKRYDDQELRSQSPSRSRSPRRCSCSQCRTD